MVDAVGKPEDRGENNIAATKKSKKSPKKIKTLATRSVNSKKAKTIRGGSQSSGAGAGKVTFSPFTVTKSIDTSST